MITAKRIILILILIAGAGLIVFHSKDKDTIPTGKSDLIRVEAPEAGSTIKSPLAISGEARGNWYFEASFPVRLYDADGKELGVAIAQAQGDWMTTEFVPFETKISFSNPTTLTGTLVFQKDNPSGLPENEDELVIPVQFTPSSAENVKTISLYYYNESKDKDAKGNVMCSAAGVEAVNRQIPVSITPIQDTIKLLMKGELINSERAKGLSTEFPLSGLELKSASLNTQGVLTLEFLDPKMSSSGGSCRVNILRAQIEATAKKFDVVKEVRYSPPNLFQP